MIFVTPAARAKKTKTAKTILRTIFISYSEFVRFFDSYTLCLVVQWADAMVENVTMLTAISRTSSSMRLPRLD